MSRTTTSIVFFVVAVALVVTAFLMGRSGGGDTATPTTTTATTTTTAPDDTTPPTVFEPTFSEADCEFDLLVEVPVRCGFLSVPENREDPGGPEVRIHVAIFESENPDAADDPIVYLDGGPGGETLDTLQFSIQTTWAPFLETRDLIFFDQRGTGHSVPSLKCDETRELQFELLDDAPTAEEFVAQEFEALTECRERLAGDDVDFTAYNSATNAADVADLRVALDIDEWNLFGISYGTRLATTVMRDHPEGVRSVILDSAYTPDVDLITRAPANLARALDVFFAGCAADAACNEAYPDLEDRFYALVDTLEDEPLETTVRDVFTGDRHDVLVNGDFLIASVFQGLYSAEVIPVLPQMITEIEAGEDATISLLLTNDLANGAFFSYGMNLAVQCNEELPFTTPEEVAAATAAQPRLEQFFAGASNIGMPMFDICELWAAGVADPVENEAVSSSIPTLVMAGEYDPITPPQWGERAASTLENVTFVEFPGLGHAASLSSDCSTEIAIAFFDNPTAEPDTGCVAAMGGPEFVIAGETVVAPFVLVEFEEDIFGVTVTGVVPDTWETVSPGAWARQTTMVDQTAIIQQAAPMAADPENLIGLLGSQLGLDDDPEPVGTEERGGRTWTRYRGNLDGFSADVAIGPGDGSTGIVILVSSADERDALVAEVLLPVLDAFATE